MKKLIVIAIVFTGILIAGSLILKAVTRQSPVVPGGKPIPENVVKIAEKSCVSCHTEPGNKMALAHVNISNWDKYSPEKQASKAQAMCNMVTKGKMPPKKFKETHPDGIPSAAEIKIICDWAQSIAIKK
jgi:hypothetical protein